MKKLIILAMVCLMGHLSVQAQETKYPELDKSPMDMAYYPARAAFRAFEKDETKKAALAPVMRVIYSRPQAKGRKVVGGELIKMNEVWRLGANEMAELTVIEKATIGGQKIKKGRYSLYTIPTDGSWTLIINKDLDGWGHYRYDESKDVLRVSGKVSKLDEHVEAFTMMFTDNSLVLAWENTKVEFPVSAM